ncbi:MAG TPA: cytochrome c biogenesis protein CcsA [Chthonomonadales bacterium]|nr:cytochrome c biogenesis protein CcsA [Chthonomonadales bacterium]
MTSGHDARKPPRARGFPIALQGAVGALMAAGIVAALTAEPVRNAAGQPTFTMGGHGAKVVFFHVPCAWMAVLAYLVGAVEAWRYLRSRRAAGRRAWLHDARSAAAMEVGLVFGVLATITGSIFSHNEWGVYWSWDPRQTSIVVVLLLFAGYLALRGAIEDPSAKARIASAYVLVAVVPAMFMIWVLPRLPDIATLHAGANQAVVGGGLGTEYRLVMYGLMLPAFAGLFAWLVGLRMRVAALEDRAVPDASNRRARADRELG